ncbi:hypothetical protein Tco_1165997 [Tanacetum coccineum]
MTGAAMVMGDKRGELNGSIGNEKLDVLSGLMDQRGVAIVREGTATRVNLDESGPYDIDVAATFGVLLITVGDLHMLVNDIEAVKHDELLSEMTNDDRMENLDALGTICNSIQVDRNVILNESDSMLKGVSSVKAPNDPNGDDNMPGMVSPSDPIVQSVYINTKSTSYAGVAGAIAKDQPKVNSNFRPLVADLVFDGVNISIPRKVVDKVSLEADLMDVVTIGIPSLIGEDFTKETIRVEYEWRPPRSDKKRKGKSKSNNGGQFVGPSVKQTVIYEPKVTTNTPKKGATNKGNESIPSSLLMNWGNSLNKDNITSSNSFSSLNVKEEEDEEEVENVYDETANLFTKIGGSSFTAAAG